MTESNPDTIVLCIGATLITAYAVKRLINRFGIPDVTGFVIFGVIIGQLFFKSHQVLLDSLDIISDLSLGIIAFIIGHELKAKVIASLGRSIFFITIFEAICAFLLVTSCLYLFNLMPFHQAILLGAVASATAPAATVYVIQQYKSKGPLTSTILAVVGIDDAIALMIYVFASNLAASNFSHTTLAAGSLFLKPLLDIGGSIIIGILAGVVFHIVFSRVHSQESVTMGITGFIVLIMGLCSVMECSQLLAVMSFSCFLTNRSASLSLRSAKVIDQLTPIFLPMFFIFAGAHLDISLLRIIGLISLLYTALRACGKIGGATLGAYLGKAPAVVRKYAGFGLIPQVGVAIALAIAIKKQFGDPNGIYGKEGAQMALLIINILLASTIITEIVGPVLTRYSLIKSGEAEIG